MSFVSDFTPELDEIRTEVPSDIGVRSVALTVRTVALFGDLMDGGFQEATDKAIVGPTGGRYKARVVNTKDVVASGGLYQQGSLRVGPITPPYAGGAWTKDDLIPPSTTGQEVYYGITDASGQTQWCTMASNDTLHDLHWYIVLNPSGVQPPEPVE